MLGPVPVFVLEPKLRKTGPALNMGFSKFHAPSVALVLNVATRLIIAQFHTAFDDWFAAVPNAEG